MLQHELQRTLPVSAHGLWNAWFHDDAFRLAIDKVMILVSSVSDLSDSGEWPDRQISRTRVFDTDRDIPKILLKLVRGMTRVTEISELDGTARTMSTNLVLPVIGGRVDFGYVYSWELGGGDSVDVTWRGHCDVRIPLVRGAAEKYLLGELVQATNDGADFVTEWFEARP